MVFFQRFAIVMAVFFATNIFTANIRSACGQSTFTLPDQPSGASVDSGEQRLDDFPALQISGDSDASTDKDGLAFTSPLVTTVSSLLVVLAIFGGVVWIARRYGHASVPPGTLPIDLVLFSLIVRLLAALGCSDLVKK